MDFVTVALLLHIILSRAWLLGFLYTVVLVLGPIHRDWSTVVTFSMGFLIDDLCVAVRIVPVATEATVCVFVCVSSALITNVVVAVGERKRKDESLRRVSTEI